ncbi:MAG: FMN-binding protein [Candidatus Saccharimonadales bacterium]
MKKYIIGIATLIVFVVYSYEVRNEHPTLSAPVSSASTKSNFQSTSASGSGTPPSGNTNTSNTQVGSAIIYKDGTYTGSTEDAYYGNLQVSATISGGKISDVTFLQSPDTHSTSVYINKQAMPYLKQEAIKAQDSKVDIISGATYTSEAFSLSLASALKQAS